MIFLWASRQNSRAERRVARTAGRDEAGCDPDTRALRDRRQSPLQRDETPSPERSKTFAPPAAHWLHRLRLDGRERAACERFRAAGRKHRRWQTGRFVVEDYRAVEIGGDQLVGRKCFRANEDLPELKGPTRRTGGGSW
jgi:hypothetical protein